MSAASLLTLALLVVQSLAQCEHAHGFDQEEYASWLLGGSIGGIAVGVVVVVLASLPLCCGVLKKYGKVIGGIAIVVGVIALVIPMIGAMGSCGPFIDAACDNRCDGEQCSAVDRQALLDACNFLGFIFVYVGVYGWAACVLGIVGASLGCCVCCQCCNAKLDAPQAQQAVGQQVVVVGKEAGVEEAMKRLEELVLRATESALKESTGILKEVLLDGLSEEPSTSDDAKEDASLLQSFPLRDWHSPDPTRRREV